jgi:hypothetical protein
MASMDLKALANAISGAQSLKPHQPEDREAAAAKIARLRQMKCGGAPWPENPG